VVVRTSLEGPHPDVIHGHGCVLAVPRLQPGAARVPEVGGRLGGGVEPGLVAVGVGPAVGEEAIGASHGHVHDQVELQHKDGSVCSPK
jgi:hypothetical protein